MEVVEFRNDEKILSRIRAFIPEVDYYKENRGICGVTCLYRVTKQNEKSDGQLIFFKPIEEITESEDIHYCQRGWYYLVDGVLYEVMGTNPIEYFEAMDDVVQKDKQFTIFDFI